VKKRWEINKKPSKKFFEQFPEYSKLILQLLWNRGLKTQKTIDEFFNSDYDKNIHDPFLMKGMKKAVERIEKALKRKEKITIFGDYDADGVCGTAILRETLKALGANPNIYIPDRNKEGCGLNFKAVKEIATKGTNLIITIDCGSADFEEVKLANKLKMDVVIVDHHEMPKKAPLAVTIVNPRQKGEKYPFKELAASGVAFKVVQALFRRYEIKNIKRKTGNKQNSLRKFLHKGWEKWLLDLVAIATVADVMPLKGENRTLVKYGLIVLAQTKRLGLKELMEKAKIKATLSSNLLVTNLDTYTLGYVIGPRLNAAGRMDHANTAYELLITKSKEEAETLARRLNSKNQDRQRLTDKIIREVKGRLKKKKKKLIFEGDRNWPAGIVGLIAGRLSSEYYCPVVIFQSIGDKIRGSARSIPSFNIIEAISRCQNLLENFGGHPGAAGFTVSDRNLKEFKQKLLKIANSKIKEGDLISSLNIDLEISYKELNFETYKEIQKFAPFGRENSKPLFLIKNLEIANLKMVGKNSNHLKLSLIKRLENGGIKRFQAIGFRLGNFYDKIKQGDKINVVFELDINEWNGTRELQLKIVDIKLALS